MCISASTSAKACVKQHHLVDGKCDRIVGVLYFIDVFSRLIYYFLIALTFPFLIKIINHLHPKTIRINTVSSWDRFNHYVIHLHEFYPPRSFINMLFCYYLSLVFVNGWSTSLSYSQSIWVSVTFCEIHSYDYTWSPYKSVTSII